MPLRIISAMIILAVTLIPFLAQAKSRTNKTDLYLQGDEGRGVISLLRLESERQGVPYGLAHKVARDESGLRCEAFNPNGRTNGLFQIKLQSARGLGFRGPESELRTCGAGLKYGLKHLAVCWRLSGSNAHLAQRCHQRGFRYLANGNKTHRAIQQATADDE